MSDTFCPECNKPLSIVHDKYYKVTIEYDTPTKDLSTTLRIHRKCFKGGRFDL